MGMAQPGLMSERKWDTMANLILRDFKLTRDFRSVNWGQTILYNLMRAMGAGVVWGIVMLCFVPRIHGEQPWVAFALPLVFPLGYFCIYLPLGLLLSVIGSIIPLVGLMSVFIALFFVTLGDPLICILYAIAPRIVPVQRPAFLSLALIYWVLKPEETALLAVSH